MRYRAYFPLIYVLCPLLTLTALAGRIRRQRAAPGDLWKGRVWEVWLDRGVNGYFYLTSAFTLVVLAMWLRIGVVEREKTAIDQSRQQLASELESLSPRREEKTLAAIYPKHPNRIGGTYYRGNDERNAALYNGGDYCTCKFHVELRGADGKPLQAADRVPVGPLSIWIEIERAPFASRALFSRPVIQTTYLSRTEPNVENDALVDEIQRFETTVAGERWAACYPLGDVLETSASQDFSGRVFLYNGGLGATVITTSPHYSIDYQLQIADGRTRGRFRSCEWGSSY